MTVTFQQARSLNYPSGSGTTDVMIPPLTNPGDWLLLHAMGEFGVPTLPVGWTVDATGSFTRSNWVAAHRVAQIGDAGTLVHISGSFIQVVASCVDYAVTMGNVVHFTTPMSVFGGGGTGSVLTATGIADSHAGMLVAMAAVEAFGVFNNSVAGHGVLRSNPGYDSTGGTCGGNEEVTDFTYTPSGFMTGPAVGIDVVDSDCNPSGADVQSAVVSYLIYDTHTTPGQWVLG